MGHAVLLAELESLPAPPGADPGNFTALKSTLADLLAARPSSALDPAPPTSDRSRAELTWDADTSTLHWYYFNNGDYNQNGEVGVSDLTPLGIHYDETADLAARTVFDDLLDGPGTSPFGTGPVAGVIDGDANGIIGISDITPLGQNFRATVTGYRVYAGTQGTDYPATNDAASALTPLAEVPFGSASGEPGAGRLQFSYQVAAPEPGMTYWVRPYYGDAEGTPSNPAGAGLEYASGALQLTGITPTAAEPGALVWLEFNLPLDYELAGVTFVINGEIDATFDLADLAIDGNLAGTAAPLLPAGTATFAAFNNGTPIGTADLTVLPGATSLTSTTASAEIELALGRFDTACSDAFEILHYMDPDLDEAGIQAELDDFNATLAEVEQWFIDELEALPPADQAAVLSYLENSGYFDLLRGLGATPRTTSHAVSQADQWNWSYLSIDMWSAAATNNAVVLDAVGLSIAVLTSGAVAPVIVAAKVLLSILDNAVDTYIPCDLYDLRIDGTTRLVESGVDHGFHVLGLFAAEKPAVNGTIEIFVEAGMAGLKLPKAARDQLLNTLLNDLTTRIASKLIKSFWSAVLPVVDDADSPADGRIGGYWQRLDMHLYTSTDWDALSDKVLYYDYYHWLEYYSSGRNPEVPGDVITFEPDWASVYSDRYMDTWHFDNNGKYVVTLRAFSFNDTESVAIFWSHTGLSELEVEVPVWVGRFGDWANYSIANQHLGLTYKSYAWISDDRPVILFRTADGYSLTYALDATLTTWSTPVQVFGDIIITDMAVINGVPALLYKDGDCRYLVFAADDAGTDWPPAGDEIPRTMRCSGTATGDGSNLYLEDLGAGFESSGVTAGCWVKLLDTGATVRVQGVVSETKLKTQPLDGEVYSPGRPYQVYVNNARSAAQCRLGVVGGVPALVYGGAPSSTLTGSQFVRAKNWLGSEWEEPVVTGEDSGTLSALRVVGGLPSYCSNYYTNGAWFRQALDATGSTWGPSHRITGMDDVLLLDFEVISGAPAICYTVQVELPPGGEVNYVNELYYSRADSSNGGSWSSPVLIGRGLETIYYNWMGEASLATINGVPGIAFFHKNYNLAYIEALDSTGYMWGEPIEVDYSSCDSISLLYFNGGPAICDVFASNDCMRFSIPEL